MSSNLVARPPDTSELAVDPDSARGHEALAALWADAVAKRQSQSGPDVVSSQLFQEVRRCTTAGEFAAVIEEHVRALKMFRKHGSKLRGVLGRVASVLVLFGDAGSASTAAIPGSKYVIVAVTNLLKATGKVSELYDTIEDVLGRVAAALERFEVYLRPATPISTELAKIIVSSLAVVLDLLDLVSKYCRVEIAQQEGRFRLWRYIMKRRGGDYLKAIFGHKDLQDKVKELNGLTDLQSLHAAAETHANVRKVQENVVEITKRWEVHENDEEYRKCEVWIEPADVDKSHVALLAKRQDSTCQWILEDASFKAWRSGANSVYSVLGHAGSGKSVMCALIIERLRNERRENPSFTLAYFYFNSTSASDGLNHHRSLIGSLLFQIARSSPQCWAYLRQERARPRGLSHPTNEQLVEMLQHLLKIAGPTLIVIDALDECHSRDPRSSGEQEAMLAFLGKIYALKLDNVHILITSRPEKKIMRRLEQFDSSRSTLSLHDDPRHQEDLARFISERLSELAFEDWGKKTLEKARNALTDMKKSQGMFLWVSLQLQHLEQSAPNQISEALDALPEGLDQTYRGILERFRSSRSSLPRVRNILGLIAFARRPLSPEEVAAAFAFNFEQLKVEPFDDEIKDVEGFVLQQLPNLIDIVHSDPRTRTVQFIHFSVKEYLTDDLLRSDGEPACRYYIDQYFADIALVTLSLTALEDQPALETWSPYAREHWHEHVSPDAADGEPDVPANVPDADARRKAARRLETALQAFLRPNCPPFERWRERQATPLHWAASLALRGHVVRLLNDFPVDILDTENQSPLVYAILRTSSRAHLDTVDLLIAHGANVGLQPEPTRWSVMHRAIHAPEPVLAIDHLVSKGAKVDATKYGDDTTLHEAAWWGKMSSVQALLRHGADINASMGGQTPLHRAVWCDAHRVITLLLEQGANHNIAPHHGCTALHYAAGFGHLASVRALLDGGATSDIRCFRRMTLTTSSGPVVLPLGATPLHLAVNSGHEDISRLLLDRTPHVAEAADWTGQTPLHYAARLGHVTILERLLEISTESPSTDAFGRTPLDLARRNNRAQCAEVLENHIQKLEQPRRQTPVSPTLDATLSSTTMTMHTLYASLTRLEDRQADVRQISSNDAILVVRYSFHLTWSSEPSIAGDHALEEQNLILIYVPPTGDPTTAGASVCVSNTVSSAGGFTRVRTDLLSFPPVTKSEDVGQGTEYMPPHSSLSAVGSVREEGAPESAASENTNGLSPSTAGPAHSPPPRRLYREPSADARGLVVRLVSGDEPAPPPVSFPLPSETIVDAGEDDVDIFWELVHAALHFQCNSQHTSVTIPYNGDFEFVQTLPI